MLTVCHEGAAVARADHAKSSAIIIYHFITVKMKVKNVLLSPYHTAIYSQHSRLSGYHSMYVYCLLGFAIILAHCNVPLQCSFMRCVCRCSLTGSGVGAETFGVKFVDTSDLHMSEVEIER